LASEAISGIAEKQCIAIHHNHAAPNHIQKTGVISCKEVYPCISQMRIAGVMIYKTLLIPSKNILFLNLIGLALYSRDKSKNGKRTKTIYLRNIRPKPER
jgi:hypothetical protein